MLHLHHGHTKSHVAVPCGHQFAYGDCADVLTRKGEPCPMCRKAISVFIQVQGNNRFHERHSDGTCAAGEVLPILGLA